MMNSSPRAQCAIRPARLDWVPEEKNRPASWPVISAKRACSALTVGSSPKTSSPTSAAAMRSRMAAVGRVTVSLRRSIKRSTGSVSVSRTLGGRSRRRGRGGSGLLQGGPVLVHGLGDAGGHVIGVAVGECTRTLGEQDVVAVVLGELVEHLAELLLDGLQQFLATLFDELAALLDEIGELAVGVLELLLQRDIAGRLGIGLVELVLQGLALAVLVVGLGLQLLHLRL